MPRFSPFQLPYMSHVSWCFKAMSPGCPIHITTERGLHSYSLANLLANRRVQSALGGAGGYSSLSENTAFSQL